MSTRLVSLPAAIALLAVSLSTCLSSPLQAKDKQKDKKKSALPEYVLRAQTVRVVITPNAGEPLDQALANSTARDNVEKALSEWGRYRIVMDGQESDLVISVRTGSGRMVRPTIQGGPVDQRGGIAQGTDSTIRIGGQQGRPPASDPSLSPHDQSPHMSNEIGSSEDTFEVFRGGPDALDSSTVWRYIGKDCLRPPNMRAVDEFRKAVANSEKPQIPPAAQP